MQAAKHIQHLISALERNDRDPEILRQTIEFLRMQFAERQERTADELRFALKVAGAELWHEEIETGKFWASPGAREILCADPEVELDPAAALGRVHEADRQRVLAARQRAIDHGTPFHEEFRIACPDGSIRWISLHAEVRVGPNGRRLAGLVHDITARKSVEAALHEKHAILQTILDSTTDYVFMKDCAGHYLAINQAAASVAAKTPDELVGKDDYAIFPPEFADRIIERDRRIMEENKGERYEESYPTATEGLRYLSTAKSPCRDSTGKVIGVVGIARDVTDRKRMEEALLKSKADAEAASNAKDHFLAVLSHELRTPLSPVLTAAQILERDPSLTPDHQKMIKMISRNVELEARLIDDLLDLTRVSRGKLELHRTVVDLHEKVQHVIHMCAQEIGDKRVTVTTDLRAKFHRLDADPARIQQIVWNLLKNAVKFTSPGEHIRISTANTSDHSAIVLEVADDGMGIEAAVLPRIFDAFEQGGREVTRQFGGLGLGLAISRTLVQLHGGTIATASEGPGRGATFTVTLPVLPDGHPGTRRAGSVSETDSTPSAEPSHLSVLIVEDHDDTRDALTLLIESMGYDARAAASVAEAIAEARQRSFDFLLCDIGLPDGSGIDVVRQIGVLHPRVASIALTGYGMEDDVRRCLEAGFARHLTKPVSGERLREVLHTLAVTHSSPRR